MVHGPHRIRLTHELKKSIGRTYVSFGWTVFAERQPNGGAPQAGVQPTFSVELMTESYSWTCWAALHSVLSTEKLGYRAEKNIQEV